MNVLGKSAFYKNFRMSFIKDRFIVIINGGIEVQIFWFAWIDLVFIKSQNK